MWSGATDTGLTDAGPSNVRFPFNYTHHGPNLTRDCFDSAEPIRD